MYPIRMQGQDRDRCSSLTYSCVMYMSRAERGTMYSWNRVKQCCLHRLGYWSRATGGAAGCIAPVRSHMGQADCAAMCLESSHGAQRLRLCPRPPPRPRPCPPWGVASALELGMCVPLPPPPPPMPPPKLANGADDDAADCATVLALDSERLAVAWLSAALPGPAALAAAASAIEASAAAMGFAGRCPG